MRARQTETSIGDLDKPRILCLHGAGASAEVFSLQMSGLKLDLRASFRLVFVNGILQSEVHPDLKPVYAGLGPTYTWMHAWADQNASSPHLDQPTIDRIRQQLVTAMKADEGWGEWMGLLGFSQGAWLAFSILLEDQRRRDRKDGLPAFVEVCWKFGVIFACPGEPLALSDLNSHYQVPRCPNDETSEHGESGRNRTGGRPILTMPTIHVCGLEDELLESHRSVVNQWCAPASWIMMQFDGGHRLPYRPADLHPLAADIIRVATANSNL